MNKIHINTPLDTSLFNRIDINLYPLFVMIYEHQSISTAAQNLFISQSAVSHALQRLRQLLCDELFIRTGRKMLPTPYSDQIYSSVKQALISIQSISIQHSDFDPSQIKTIKIAIHDEIEPIIFPKLIHHFDQLNLNIQFLSIKLDRKTVESELMSQQIDFVIDLEHLHSSSNISFESLVQDQFVVCSQLKKMDKKTYLNAPHIGVSSRRTGVLIEDYFLHKEKISRQIFMRCQHYSTAFQILLQRPTALLTLPKTVVTHSDLNANLYISEVPFELPDMNIGIYWNSSLQDNSRIKFVKKEVSEIFA